MGNTEKREMRVQMTRSCEDREKLIKRRAINFEKFVGMFLEGNTSHWGLGVGTGGRWLGPAEIGKSQSKLQSLIIYTATNSH